MTKASCVKPWLLAGTIIIHCVSHLHANDANCTPAAAIRTNDGRNGFEIDRAWSGATVAFDAISRDGKDYVGYYDADRWLTVARLDPASGIACRLRLPSQFAGWDGHNYITLAFDAGGHLQIAGNMHSSPLVYGSAQKPDSIEGLALAPMTGQDEERVTYPNFINAPDGTLYFIYRTGESGNGAWIINAHEGPTWKRALNKPVFSSVWDGKPTNAYPSPFRFFSDGYVHVAIVWRRTPDIASNYAITYARTRDFSHWEDHNGRSITPPLHPGNSDMVEMPGEGKGLINLPKVGVTESGRPIIAYTKYGADGKNSVILASPSQNRWHLSTVATAEQQTLVEGGGTIPNLPSFGDLYVDDGQTGYIDVAFPGEKRMKISFDVDTLEVVDARESEVRSTTRTAGPKMPLGLVDIQSNHRNVRVDGLPDKTAGRILYFSQGLNRDRARDCTRSQPTACNPQPSPLIVFPE